MLLAVDIGNTDVTFGVYSDGWKHIWRLSSSSNFELYYAIRLRDFFLEADLPASGVETIVMSSVVPNVTPTLTAVVRTLFGKDPLLVGVDIYPTLPLKVLNPYEIGSDLVANAVAAWSYCRKLCTVVDFGTALTFTTVSADGVILGVAIAPGLKTAIRSLSQNTAKLFDVPLEFPSSVLGKGTVHAIQAGILFGYEGMVKNVLLHIELELGAKPYTFATGGLSTIIPSVATMADEHRPNLTLDGLRIISTIVNG